MIHATALVTLKVALELVDALERPHPVSGAADVAALQERALDALVAWGRAYRAAEEEQLNKIEISTRERQARALEELAAIARRIA